MNVSGPVDGYVQAVISGVLVLGSVGFGLSSLCSELSSKKMNALEDGWFSDAQSNKIDKLRRKIAKSVMKDVNEHPDSHLDWPGKIDINYARRIVDGSIEMVRNHQTENNTGSAATGQQTEQTQQQPEDRKFQFYSQKYRDFASVVSFEQESLLTEKERRKCFFWSTLWEVLTPFSKDKAVVFSMGYLAFAMFLYEFIHAVIAIATKTYST